MQLRRAILQSLIYHILQLFMGKSHLFQLSMHAVLCLSSFCGTHKEVHMEIHEALSFYHLRVKYVTLQELLANNTRSLIRDSKKNTKKSQVIKNECQVWVELYHSYIIFNSVAMHNMHFRLWGIDCISVYQIIAVLRRAY